MVNVSASSEYKKRRKTEKKVERELKEDLYQRGSDVTGSGMCQRQDELEEIFPCNLRVKTND